MTLIFNSLINNRENFSTYLGNKGYTILKKDLSLQELNEIKADLTAKPHIHGAPLSQATVFPVYRESNQKIYVPHYYGIEKFGVPKEYKLNQGDNINLEFNGSLRDYQQPVVKKYLETVKNIEAGGGLLELPCAFGKTILSLNILSALKKKTLIIVHKEFLLNQWVERIEEFLPKARIGRIQGQILDIDDKDIVIGMLQSLSMKEYPSSIFESFGLTIIDEVHHISSEVFSNSLFKIVTKYMLGLSATMNRKDGTTKIFKMFLGPVIFKGEMDEKREVTVRAIEYQVEDEEFNKEITDYRGNPAYSTMITKLCEYNRRSDFILKVLKDLLQENPLQQIMILAHNKSILKYLHDAIQHKEIATVGYYVGGMKEAALKQTETKKIVIATYSMASEALDIKTLTTLIMCTPRSDIQQSVGRILREKHSQPIVVDIIDSHDIFKNQWKKRKAFYKKENYQIYYCCSKNYSTDLTKWTIVNQISGNKVCNKKTLPLKNKKKGSSERSKSSTDQSITQDSSSEDDDDEEECILETPDTKKKNDLLCGKCFIKLK
jgi:superfamily II DNA or RNA helicase